MTNEISRAAALLQGADHILVSASNGLSISEGYHIFADNDAFKKYFGPFRDKYGIHSIIQGVFAQLPLEASQEFHRQLKKYMIDDYTPSPSLQDLKKLLSGSDTFIVTSNSDTHFQLNGFDPDRLFEVEGNFFGRREGDPEWTKQLDRFKAFLDKIKGSSTVVFELGIGARNQLIKAPLMQLVAQSPTFHYITCNLPAEIFIPDQIADRSLALAGDLAETFKELCKAEGK